MTVVASNQTDQKPTQELAKTRVVEGEIVSAADFNARVSAWRAEGYNVLTPAVSLSSIPRDHKIVMKGVQINPNPAGGEVYQNRLFTKDGEVALTKAGLERVAQAASISIDLLDRVDSRTVEFVWTFRVHGHWIDFDGERIDRIASRTLDLRDGSPDIKGFTANQIEQTRRHGEAICESKAINRLYRMYGLRQKYTQRELAERPFIVLKLQWEPDMTNPVVAAIRTQMKMGATTMLYPQGAIDPSTLPSYQVPPELRPPSIPRHVAGDDDDPPVSTQGERPFDEVEAEDAKKAEAEKGGVLVMGVTKQGDTDDYFVLLEDGRKLHTTDKAVAKAANDARKAGTRLQIEIEQKGGVLEILEIGGGKY